MVTGFLRKGAVTVTINICPYSLMDKTRGFYPFDVGSIPAGGTNYLTSPTKA